MFSEQFTIISDVLMGYEKLNVTTLQMKLTLGSGGGDSAVASSFIFIQLNRPPVPGKVIMFQIKKTLKATAC